VSGGYEVVDCNFVLLEEGMDVGLVEDFCALCLREDEVQEETKAEPCVEGDPTAFILVQCLYLRISGSADQNRMNPAHDSTSKAHANTTQYINHGVRRAGSEVLRAL
jgi:hypothetical protein